MKKLITSMALLFCAFFAFAQSANNKPYDDSITAWDFVDKLDAGFQFSVTADKANPNVSKEDLKNIKTKGFKTVRFQTNPGSYMLDEKYTIDPDYISALKQLVDWAIEEDLYVILTGPLNSNMEDDDFAELVEEDIHYASYVVSEDYKKDSEAFLKAVWKQFTAVFNNAYDEHLVFETLNEPIDCFHEHSFHEREKCEDCKADYAILNGYNQLILDTIRSSGGNNAKRFVMVEGMSGRWENITTKAFKLPKDKAKGKLIPAFHFNPMGKTGSALRTVYYQGITKDIKECFNSLDKAYFSKKTPVYITEGLHDKSIPVMERINCLKDILGEAAKKGRCCGIVLHEDAEKEYIDSLVYALDGREYQLSEDFIKKNEHKVESIVGKNILPEPWELKDWEEDCVINPDILARSTPAKYRLEVELEWIGHRPVLQFGYIDKELNKHDAGSMATLGIEGGTLRGVITVKSEKIIFTIDDVLANRLLNSNSIYLNGEALLVKSIKVLNYK